MKTQKCGFTVIELVIAIAIIAILSGILIPTFGGIIESARNSSRDLKAKNAYIDYLTYHPTNEESYLFIEIEDGGVKYYYSVAEGQIDLDHESKAISQPLQNGVEYSGYTVYTATSLAHWLERWNNLVNNGTSKATSASIIYTNPYSAILENQVVTKNVKSLYVSDFVNHFSELTFEEVSCEDKEYKTAGKCQIVFASKSFTSDSDGKNQYYYTYFTVSEEGYVFAITKALTFKSPFELHFFPVQNGTVLKSTSPIDKAVINEYFENCTE